MFILASASPRREELLKKIIDNFKIIPSSIKEDIPDNIAPMNVSEYLSTQKALDIYKKNPNDTIISADTTIVFNNKIYGKASSKEQAKQILKLLSNSTHFVVTGVTVMSSKRSISFSSINEVTFYNLSDKEIDDYLSNDEYLDKAGAYAIQGRGGLLVKKINGDYNSIIGLPISELNQIIKRFF